MRLIILLCLLSSLACRAESALAGTSFERESDLRHIAGSGFGIGTNRAQFGMNSLKLAGGELTVSNLRSLSREESGSAYGSQFPLSPTFVMSLYHEEPTDDRLRIEFNGEVCFEINLNFKGWRTVWVPYYEMEGNAPEAEAAYAVREVNFSTSATVWFDDIVFSQYIDDRHPYPGLEVPFIKGGGAKVNDHWMPKIMHWKMLSELPVASITSEQQADLKTIETRLQSAYFKKTSQRSGADYFRKKLNFDLPLKLGLQVDPVRYNNPEYAELRGFGKLMFQLATEYLSSGDAELSELFAEASQYYLDQGWAEGSSQGTAHHIGYATRKLQTAFFLMRNELEQDGLLISIGNSVRWQLNFGEMLDPDHLESNLDYYNTQSVFRLMSAFLTPDSELKFAFLTAYSAHFSAALALTNSQGFRPDGTAWHHNGHYPAYATGAFARVPVSLKVLSGTSFRVGESGHANFKRAFLSAAIYSNPLYYGLGQAGRHPLGGNLGKLQDASLALALSGTPDGQQPVDPDIASVYVRLWGSAPDAAFAGLELDPAPPNGHWTFPYAALSVHRRNDWSVNIKGYSKYVWASEIYKLDNRYGRYQSSGVVQVLPNMPQEEAGYSEDGWDWNHPPGATTIDRPFIELEPEDELVMFKSDESYAGGCALDGNGVWAMKLNEADGFTIDPVKKKMSFPGNLKARKSVFCFGEQLLCLGSGIESDDPSAPVHTTLFQNGIKEIDDTVYHNGSGLLTDPIGNVYRVLNLLNVVVQVGEQVSPNNKYSLRREEGKKGAQPAASGLFAKAWIDHGAAPKNEAYAYSVFPMIGSIDRIGDFPLLEILRQDNTAHVVQDVESRTTAYACFDSGAVNLGLLESVSVPCYVMIREGDTLRLAVANPDLNQLEVLDQGHFIGDPKEAPVVLKLAGCWKIKGAASARAEVDGASTRLIVTCVDGMPIEVELEGQE